MAEGDWHKIGDLEPFMETLHGPNVTRSCIDCGRRCYSVPSCPDPRCTTCATTFRGALPGPERLALRTKFPRARG